MQRGLLLRYALREWVKKYIICDEEELWRYTRR
jgi:hypothetical protein